MYLPRHFWLGLVAVVVPLSLLATERTLPAQTIESIPRGNESTVIARPSPLIPCHDCLPRRRYGAYEPEVELTVPPPPPAFPVSASVFGWYGGWYGAPYGWPAYSYGFPSPYPFYGIGYGGAGLGPWPGTYANPGRWYYGQSWYAPSHGFYW